MQPAKTGVLGLGIIGSIWARHLHDDGLLAGCWNRTPKPDQPGWKKTPPLVADEADHIIVAVSDPSAVNLVLWSIRHRLTAKHLVIQCSTIDPASSRRFEALVRERGAAYVEAPFTGSKPAAEARKTVFYLGGQPEAVARAEAALAPLSEKRFVIGTGSQAAALKLACNVQLAVQLEAACEALAWARREGIPDDVYFEALRANAAWSGLLALKEPKLRAGDFSPQFSVKHMLKDMRLAVAATAEQVPLAAFAAERLKQAADAGHGSDDMSALLTLLPQQSATRAEEG